MFQHSGAGRIGLPPLGERESAPRSVGPAHTASVQHTGGDPMSTDYGRIARALLLAGGIATAVALPSIAGTPLLPSHGANGANVALAAPAMDNDNNDDRTNDNSDERNIEGQILEINEGSNPPQALVGMVGGNV